MKKPLVIPSEFNRNHPEVAAIEPEKTGSTLINLVVGKLGLTDLSDTDVLDVGCGVRFTQAIINCDIPIKSYTGIDVDKALIDYLNEVVADSRFAYYHWNVHNQLFNPLGVKLTKDFTLPVSGQFDLIWLFSVFTHLEPADANALLGILRRYIRLGGHLFFSTFIDNSILTFEDRIPYRPLVNAYYSEPYMRQLLEQNGWTTESVNDKSAEHYIQHYFICTPHQPAINLTKSKRCSDQTDRLDSGDNTTIVTIHAIEGAK